MKQRLYHSAYLPKNLNLEEVISANAPTELKFLKYYRYFITKIIDERLKNEQYSANDYVRLKTEYLRRIMTVHNTKRIIENLQKWNIIEVDNSYRQGVSSKGYRLCYDYRNEEYLVSRIKDAKMSNKIYYNTVIRPLNDYTTQMEQMVNKETQTGTNNNYTPYGVQSLILFNNLTKHLDSISIDAERAINFVNSNYTGLEKSRHLAFIHKFQNSEHFFTISKKVGRVFTTISNCPKTLVQFLTIDGKKLKEIDIANSQPLFLNILINEFLNKAGKEITKDVELYREKTMSGELYQFLNSRCNEIKTVEELKDLLFRFVFYSKNSKSSYNFDFEPFAFNKELRKIKEIKEVFSTIFPTVFDVIKHYKKVNYANLSIELQRIESSFIIPIALELSKDFPLFTKHDAILAFEENLFAISNALINSFQLQNLTAKLRLK